MFARLVRHMHEDMYHAKCAELQHWHSDIFSTFSTSSSWWKQFAQCACHMVSSSRVLGACDLCIIQCCVLCHQHSGARLQACFERPGYKTYIPVPLGNCFFFYLLFLYKTQEDVKHIIVIKVPRGSIEIGCWGHPAGQGPRRQQGGSAVETLTAATGGEAAQGFRV